MYLLALAACAAPLARDHAGTEAPSPDPECVALLQARPSEWSERLVPVLARGPAAGPDLLGALRESPDAPGATAAVAVLGDLGHAPARPWLEEQVARRTPLRVEAALALGRLPAPQSVPLLRGTANDRLSDSVLRAACAAALVELGEGVRIASLVRALVLAGSPAGRRPGSEAGLPDKPRWAMERYLVLRALRHVAPDQDFGLDTDSPWPELEQSAEAVDRWLRAR